VSADKITENPDEILKPCQHSKECGLSALAPVSLPRACRLDSPDSAVWVPGPIRACCLKGVWCICRPVRPGRNRLVYTISSFRLVYMCTCPSILVTVYTKPCVSNLLSAHRVQVGLGGVWCIPLSAAGGVLFGDLGLIQGSSLTAWSSYSHDLSAPWHACLAVCVPVSIRWLWQW